MILNLQCDILDRSYIVDNHRWKNQSYPSIWKAYIQLVTQETAIDNTRAQVGMLTNETDDNEIRLRSLAKIKFGADSMQFGQLAGTRSSERKKSKGRPPKNSDKPANNQAFPASN